ncbi:MAG: D-alanyl-D-alanine carboxypeptidase/D-alanyl-D-alanine endopeptidase [Pseudomonadota bacterium]|uniref:D-alanyl-D-alanine carboxypeptidase/D-alanyl-D-alanine endopeptidase n=1 Tax=Roseovarius TaxID=74030 RepID=UPI0022A888E5|nr:D-alanyl-D-alanine carboxypeptidase/D-alanyl-D-alanine-endopeptidase [Roseovarius sp. EGI FJ00037]MCZ0812429.1 D-alanyl-D-alanine carboxypeptidase/D-alanyl-D-alanine-endopeptidase [Roseovarius sp. EGI FJ00037]
MSRPVSRRVFLGSALGAIGALAPLGASVAWAGAPAVSLRPQARPGSKAARVAPGAEKLVESAKLGGDVTFAVMDVKTGLMLETRGAHDGLPPASVTKSVTALYALATLGADFRFSTRLLTTGAIENGVIKGDLILAGGGDPTLDTDALADMAAELKRKGVHEVRGRFHVWGGALPFERTIDPTQPEHAGYNPSISGMNLNFNRVHFEWKRGGSGYQVTMDARARANRPAVTIARMAVSQRKGPVYTYRDGGDHDSWTVANAALGNGGARWLPVRKPEAYAAEVFATLVRSHGIVLEGGAALREPPKGKTLVVHQSAPLREVLRDMLKYSNNLTAELIGMTASAKRVGRAQSLAASAREMSRWARTELGMEAASLVDHSGLGEKSRLSAEALAQAMVKARRDGQLRAILKEIPLRDDNGAVNKRNPIKVVAKTGTLYFVSSLSGYMTTPDGSELAFAILAANQGRRRQANLGAAGRPPGAAGWNGRAKTLQQALIERWGAVYGS